MKKFFRLFLLSTMWLAIIIYIGNGQTQRKEIINIQDQKDSDTVKNGKPAGKLNLSNTKKATNRQSAWSVSRIGDTSKSKIKPQGSSLK